MTKKVSLPHTPAAGGTYVRDPKTGKPVPVPKPAPDKAASKAVQTPVKGDEK